MILNRKRLVSVLSVITGILLIAAILKWSSNYRANREETVTPSDDPTVEETVLPEYNKLTYYNGSTTLDFMLTEDGTWAWTADQDFPLDTSVIETIFGLLEKLNTAQTVPAPEDLEEYGLNSTPSATLTASGDHTDLTLTFGKETEDGGRYAFKNGDETTVYLMPAALLKAMAIPVYDMMILPEIPEMLPSRMDFIRIYGNCKEDGSYETYTIITAQRPQTAETLTDEDITWRSNGANVTDDPTVQTLLNNLTTLTIDQCLDYHPSEEASALCGFNAPTAKLEVDFHTDGGAEQSLILTIGNPLPDDSGRYVRYGDEDPTLYRLSADTLDALLRIAAEGLEG